MQVSDKVAADTPVTGSTVSEAPPRWALGISLSATGAVAKRLVKRIAMKVLPDAVMQSLKKVHYARMLKRLTDDREPDIKLVRFLLRPGKCVLDIGANIGVITKFSSEIVGRQGHVYSIEPVPTTFDVLSSNVKKFGLANVDVINCAISDAEGTVTMEVPRYKGGGENFYEARIISDSSAIRGHRLMSIKARTIDALFGGSPEIISFIKCDVEGHELKVIRGALLVIEKHRPAWLIEIAGDPDDPASAAFETFRLLESKDYSSFWFDGRNFYERLPGDKSINYFFLMPEHLAALLEGGFPASQIRRHHQHDGAA